MEIDTVRVVLLVATVILFRYVWVVFGYRQSRRHYHNNENCIEQLPPTHPSLIPFLGNGLSFAWDTALFTQLATSYKKTLVSTRASVFGSSIYFFQDRETVCKLIKQRNSLIPIAIRFVFPAKVLFGMPEENGLDAYRQDNSGPLSKPEAGSSIPDQDRIDHLHHQAFQHAFIGPGLSPIAMRSREAVDEKFNNFRLDSSEWTEIDDLFAVIGKAVSAGLTEAMCGPSILKLHPDFIDNLWDFDRATPWLVRLIPRWINPHPHRARDTVLEQIRNWHVYARQMFHEGLIGPDGDSDPYWGSKIIRHFQHALWKSGKHGDDAMAAHDLALIWGATSNVASVTGLAVFHIFKDRYLTSRIRSELRKCQYGFPETKNLSKLPLLSSIYAETLRLYQNAFLVSASPPDRDILLGKWKFPRRSMSIISPALLHQDESFWNTKGDLYPVNTFWADRFLVYPGDPESGPIRPECRKQNVDNGSDSEPYYSTEGLKSSWLPFGTGNGMCPGRFLARDAIISTCALLVERYDIEIITESLDMDPWRFGLSVGRPRSPIAARIRRRR